MIEYTAKQAKEIAHNISGVTEEIHNINKAIVEAAEAGEYKVDYTTIGSVYLYIVDYFRKLGYKIHYGYDYDDRLDLIISWEDV